MHIPKTVKEAYEVDIRMETDLESEMIEALW